MLCFLLLLIPALASAQTSQPVHDFLRVYLVTFGPGSDPWEKFGHDCIVIEDEEAKTSLAYNWGVFSFGEGVSGFLGFGVQFLRGRLLYSMQSDPTGPMIDAYKQNGRSVLIQELEMTPAQKIGLQARLIANDTEANRYYLYDYFKKNCATMCRDEIDRAVNGQIDAALTKIQTHTTYRWHDQRATADCLWLYLFLDYSLGHAVDVPLSAWDESFLPGKFAGHLRSVNVLGESGQMEPIVKLEKQLSRGTITEREVPPKSFFYYFLAGGIAAGGLLAGLALVGTRYRLIRWLFILVAMGWSLLAGLMGSLLTYAWFSDHLAAKWNENWFQANPLSMLLVVLIPMAYRWPRAARWVGLIVLGLSALDLLAKITPWAWQVNGLIIAIALPIHAAVAWGIIRLPFGTKRQIDTAADQSSDPIRPVASLNN